MNAFRWRKVKWSCPFRKKTDKQKQNPKHPFAISTTLSRDIWNFFLNPDIPSQVADVVFICRCDSEQKEKEEGSGEGGEGSPCGLHPALQSPPQGKHNLQYFYFPPLSCRLQRLAAKLKRTAIDPTSDGLGIDNWTLWNALLSCSALKISTGRPSRRGVLFRPSLCWMFETLAAGLVHKRFGIAAVFVFLTEQVANHHGLV